MKGDKNDIKDGQIGKLVAAPTLRPREEGAIMTTIDAKAHGASTHPC